MIKRSVCIYNGKPIGIESIYTVIDGKQINIPEKLKWLSSKSKNHELFCPCGCRANLTLVAGQKMLRAQHFRINDAAAEKECTYVEETQESLDSKVFCIAGSTRICVQMISKPACRFAGLVTRCGSTSSRSCRKAERLLSAMHTTAPLGPTRSSRFCERTATAFACFASLIGMSTTAQGNIQNR